MKHTWIQTISYYIPNLKTQVIGFKSTQNRTLSPQIQRGPTRRVEINPPGREGWAIGVVWISSGASDARTRVRILYRPLSYRLQAK